MLSILRRTAEWLARTRPREEKTHQTGGTYTDAPIKQIADDCFGFGSYVITLADRVEHAETPLTIGVFGRWGVGKSSLMRLLQSELQKRAQGKPDALMTLWINVWQLNNQDEVWHAFLQALFSEVHRKLGPWHRIDKLKLAAQVASNSLRIILVITPMVLGQLIGHSAAGWDDVVSLVIARGGVLTTIGLGLWVVTRAKPILEAAKETANIDLRETLKLAPYEAQITTLRQLKGQFEQMVNTLAKEDGHLIVFIDDLDRCAPDKIPDILEAIKLFTTSKHCVYVLGLDHDIVRRGVMGKYTFSDDQATEYLEKIIQIPFHLPPLARKRIASFVSRDYPDVCEACPDAPEIFASGLEPNPRKVKRALNIYRTLLNLVDVRVENEGIDPLEPELLAKMVVIQSRFLNLYKALVQDLGLFGDLETWARYFRHPEETAETAEQEVEEEEMKRVRARIEEPVAELGRPLVPPDGRPALAAMLKAGSLRFGELDRNELKSYIYFTGTLMSERFVFEPSPSLTPELRRSLEASVASFIEYLENLGYKPKMEGRIRVNVQPHVPGTAVYYPERNTISIDQAVARDPDVALKKYADHVLVSSIRESLVSWAQVQMFEGIESGLADYLTCSFNNNSKLGEVSAKQLSLKEPYIRNLDNNRKFSELASDADKWAIGETWGGAFWEIRQKLGQATADKLLFSTWTALQPSDARGNAGVNFVKELLEMEQTLEGGQNADQIRSIFERRDLK